MAPPPELPLPNSDAGGAGGVGVADALALDIGAARKDVPKVFDWDGTG